MMLLICPWDIEYLGLILISSKTYHHRDSYIKSCWAANAYNTSYLNDLFGGSSKLAISGGLHRYYANEISSASKKYTSGEMTCESCLY